MPLATASKASTASYDAQQLSRCCCSCSWVMQCGGAEELQSNRVCSVSEKEGRMGKLMTGDGDRIGGVGSVAGGNVGMCTDAGALCVPDAADAWEAAARCCCSAVSKVGLLG